MYTCMYIYLYGSVLVGVDILVLLLILDPTPATLPC